MKVFGMKFDLFSTTKAKELQIQNRMREDSLAIARLIQKAYPDTGMIKDFQDAFGISSFEKARAMFNWIVNREGDTQKPSCLNSQEKPK